MVEGITSTGSRVTEIGSTACVRRTRLVQLPVVHPYGRAGVQLTMHTDNINILASFLRDNLTPAEQAAIRVEGRYFSSYDIRTRLTSHPVYDFYLNGRHSRTQKGLVVLLRHESPITKRQARKLAKKPFTPFSSGLSLELN